MTARSTTADTQPHELTLAWAERVASIVGSASNDAHSHKTPPRDAFRNNLAGRKAWLVQAERTLKFCP
jgi:hypothetical protein